MAQLLTSVSATFTPSSKLGTTSRMRKIAIYVESRLQMELLRSMNILSKEALLFFLVMSDQVYQPKSMRYVTSLCTFLSMAVALPP
ncbi:hypothetical protein HID58_077676 [Brassica napus]|uniref:Uncharacterized protein n=1 Tax=Brassica napus TaxID=3708 RepID=A0ABQ7YR28_BRANA|nr:hypothetical protein HID58_077676 [Brassica napus]